MDVKARVLKKEVDQRIVNIVLSYRNLVTTAKAIRTTLMNYIQEHPTEYNAAFTTEEKQQITNLNTTFETLETYVETNLPEFPTNSVG